MSPQKGGKNLFGCANDEVGVYRQDWGLLGQQTNRCVPKLPLSEAVVPLWVIK